MIAEHDVRPPHDLGQNRARIAVPPGPQLGSVVPVERHADILGPGRIRRGDHRIRRPLPERRRHPRHVQDVGVLEQLVPIEIGRAGQRETAVLAIVEDRRRPDAGALLDEVEAHAARRARHARHIDPVATQVLDRRLAQPIVGKAGDHRCPVTEIRQADCDIGLRAAEVKVEPPRLHQQLAVRRGQPHHQLAEADDLAHRGSTLLGDVERFGAANGSGIGPGYRARKRPSREAFGPPL